MSDEAEDKLREIAEQRVKKRRDAFEDLVAYVLINAILWIIWLALLPNLVWLSLSFITLVFFALSVVTLIWGFVVMWQIAEALLRPRLDASYQREVQRELDRLREGLLSEKPKRSRLAVSDDGELVEMVKDEEATDEEWERRST
jgi:threonine/homoserine/homoserine lactone efflux protein